MTWFPHGNGYQCAICGAFVPNGVVHRCGGTPWDQRFPQPVSPPTVTWIQKGWECPSCGGGVAPFMPYCPLCAPKKDAPTPTDPGEETKE